jgi:hypothetical protein
LSAARAAAAALVTALALAAVAAMVDRAALMERASALRWGWLLAASALGPLQLWLGARRWARVSALLGAPLGPGEALAEMGLSSALNQLLPGGIGGDLLRVGRQRERGWAVVVAAAVTDRAAGLGSLCAVALAAWAWSRLAAPWPLGVAAMASLAGIAGWAWWVGRGGPLRDPLVVGLSATLTASFLLGFALAGLAVGVRPGPWVAEVAPWLLLVMALPLSFAGWGAREVAAMGLWPHDAAEGVAVSAAYGLSVLLGALPGGLWWALRRSG